MKKIRKSYEILLYHITKIFYWGKCYDTITSLPCVKYNEVISTNNLRVLEKSLVRCHDSKLIKAWNNISDEILEHRLKDPFFVLELTKEADLVIDMYDFLVNKNTLAEIRYKREISKPAEKKVEFEEMINFVEEVTGRNFDQNTKTVKELLILIDKCKTKTKK